MTEQMWAKLIDISLEKLLNFHDLEITIKKFPDNGFDVHWTLWLENAIVSERCHLLTWQTVYVLISYKPLLRKTFTEMKNEQQNVLSMSVLESKAHDNT